VLRSPLMGGAGLTIKPEGPAKPEGAAGGVSPVGPGSAAQASSPKRAKTRVEQTRKPEKAEVAYLMPLAVAYWAAYENSRRRGTPIKEFSGPAVLLECQRSAAVGNRRGSLLSLCGFPRPLRA
jgi:hypothetical protein